MTDPMEMLPIELVLELAGIRRIYPAYLWDCGCWYTLTREEWQHCGTHGALLDEVLT